MHFQHRDSWGPRVACSAVGTHDLPVVKYRVAEATHSRVDWIIAPNLAIYAMLRRVRVCTGDLITVWTYRGSLAFQLTQQYGARVF